MGQDFHFGHQKCPQARNDFGSAAAQFRRITLDLMEILSCITLDFLSALLGAVDDEARFLLGILKCLLRRFASGLKRFLQRLFNLLVVHHFVFKVADLLVFSPTFIEEILPLARQHLKEGEHFFGVIPPESAREFLFANV